MAGTTNFYGISYPTSTDYVKDGATAMQTIATGFDSVVAIPTYNNQTGTSYTFVLADTGKVVTANNASAVTFTIPPQSSVTWTANTSLRVTNLGAGALSIAGGAGVTVTNSSATVAQYSSATVVRTGSDAWTVVPAGAAASVTKIASGTFSAVSAVNLSSVLSSTYRFYELNVYATCSGVEQFRMRFRENTTDYASSYFNGSLSASTTGTVANYRPENNTSSFNIGDIGSASFNFNVKLHRPDATKGLMTITGYSPQNAAAFYAAGTSTGMTNFNGLSFYPGNNTITGAYLLTGWN